MRGRDRFERVKPVLLFLSRGVQYLPHKFRYGVLALLRGTPGLVGLGLRYVCVHSLARSCGDNVYIGPYCFLSYLENCEIGDNVSIREFCNIGCQGGVRIGSDVSLAAGTVVLSTEHDYQQTTTDMRSAPAIFRETVIEDGAWIGVYSVLTAGVTVGEGSVIGSGAVVTKDIPPFSIAVGIPAKVIGLRDNAG